MLHKLGFATGVLALLASSAGAQETRSCSDWEQSCIRSSPTTWPMSKIKDGCAKTKAVCMQTGDWAYINPDTGVVRSRVASGLQKR